MGANRTATGATTSSNARDEQVAGGSGRQRKIDREAGRVRPTGLVDAAGPGIEAVLMGRDVTHPVVVPEQRLGAVAVVHVPVDDDHALAPVRQRGSRDGDIVHQAEAHRAVGEGVMTRRPGHDERGVAFTVGERVDCGQPGTRRLTRRVPRHCGPRTYRDRAFRHRRHRTLRARGGMRHRVPRRALRVSRARVSTSTRSVPNIRSSMPAAAASTRLGRSGWPGCMCSTDTTGPATISFGTFAIQSTHALLDERAQ